MKLCVICLIFSFCTLWASCFAQSGSTNFSNSTGSPVYTLSWVISGPEITITMTSVYQGTPLQVLFVFVLIQRRRDCNWLCSYELFMGRICTFSCFALFLLVLCVPTSRQGCCP